MSEKIINNGQEYKKIDDFPKYWEIKIKPRDDGSGWFDGTYEIGREFIQRGWRMINYSTICEFCSTDVNKVFMELNKRASKMMNDLKKDIEKENDRRNRK